jgi:tRNA(Ile2) C34 agmatinyltransferase TiaS
MIIAGVLAPLAGPVFGMGEHLGKCPSCGTRMISTTDAHAHGCPVCNEKFAIGDQEAVGAK